MRDARLPARVILIEIRDSSKTRYIPSVRELVRQHLRFFLFVTLAAVALRLLFIFRFPAITTDSFVYGDIAKNWLQHGIYGQSGPEEISPTYVRLPGYPAFLAAVFAIFGMEHYRAVLVVQMFVDIGTCFLIADMTRRVVSPRAAKAAFLLAALCPFLANYVAVALTETLEVFFTVLALDLAIIGLGGLDAGQLRPWLGCGLAVGAAILLRPDGGLLLVAIGAYLMWVLVRRVRAGQPFLQVLWAGVMVGAISLAPLIPWTLRNLGTLHQFEPLAPRYANEPDEFVPMGFNRWVRTWIADYSSVEEIYWQVPGAAVDAGKLPARAFDSEEQSQRTLQLLADYNQGFQVTPDLDARFAALAAERNHDAPLRYYLWLPMVRIAGMWLRPRTELLPADSRWWEFNDDLKWSILAVTLGVIGILYAAGAFAGLLRARSIPHLGLLLTFVILRSAFLGTLENPEPRYTLEGYPIVILLASTMFI
ncbi:MAG TPA: glycosyltransferase family 39 protein [Terriglobales bacterium]|nr:glycosyltransferase family 39 protein [Terriglobales bacterium]